MAFNPSLEIHPHQEFHFADNTDSQGCCCCWQSKSKEQPEYYIKKSGIFVPKKNSTMSVEDRIKANCRLANIVQSKFEDDPIDNNQAFDRLRLRINHNFESDESITEEKLIHIINAIYEIKADAKSQK